MPNNLYLLRDTAAGEAVVVDPSIGSDEALSRVQRWQQDGTRLTAIWNTHGHFDHIYDNARWKSAFQVPLGMNAEDNFFIERLREQALWFGLPQPAQMFPDFEIKGGDVLRVGSYDAQILEVPVIRRALLPSGSLPKIFVSPAMYSFVARLDAPICRYVHIRICCARLPFCTTRCHPTRAS